jgi:LytS/YehU family sensor histidine kinase
MRFASGYFLDFFLTFVALLLLDLTFNIFRRTGHINDNLILKVAILSALVLFIYRVIYALMYSYNQYTIAQIETVKNERKQMELQFQALKSQVSPHYLFNSLNTISSLMIRDVASAEQFIRRLAQTYQYVLKNQDKTYVLLEEEIDFVKSYYYLLRIRFQQQVEVEINVPAIVMKSKIPPLTLQMLVENAVKHNAMRSDKKLFIYITAQDNTYLRVINTKSDASGNVESFNVGLENIRRRYQFFTSESVVIDDREKFSVALPVLNSIQKEQKFSA